MFSPQRRKILGAKGRLSPKKTALGTEEAVNVGPKQLFNDLKQTSSKKPSASTSTSLFGGGGTSKSRAFGEKTNKSPQRSKANNDGESVPVKPKNTQSPVKGKLKAGNSRPDFVTPTASVGHAGVLKMQMGQTHDAKAGGDLQLSAKGDSSVNVNGKTVSEEDLYPEIEYMPPANEVAYDFPTELDGLPRGAEMGDMLQTIVAEGFYKPQRPESIESQRREDLANIPDSSTTEFVNQIWPDVEQKKTNIIGTTNKIAPSSYEKGKLQSIKPSAQAIRKPSGSAKEMESLHSSVKKSTSATDRGVESIKKTSNRTINAIQNRKLTTKAAGTNGVTIKPKALSVKDNNAQLRRTTGISKSKLEDFETDRLSKSIQVKARQCDRVSEFEGFEL